MCASEGTDQEQAERFHDYGTCLGRHSSARVHLDGRRTFVENRAFVCWADVELQTGEVQFDKGRCEAVEACEECRNG